MRRAVGASVLVVLALRACGNGTSRPPATTIPAPARSAKPSSATVPVNQSLVQSAPGGSPVKVYKLVVVPSNPVGLDAQGNLWWKAEFWQGIGRERPDSAPHGVREDRS